MSGKWIRKFGAGVSAYLLGLALLFCSSLAIFYFVLSQPAPVKNIIRDSGAYGKFVDAFLDNAANQDQAKNTIPLGNPQIQKAVHQAFPPEVLRTNTEKIIDGTYEWLDGETDQAEFTLDFTKSKQTLAEETGNYARERAAGLPPCTLQNIPTETRAFKIDCLPPGITPSQIGDKVTQDLKQDKNFLPDPVVTEDNLFNNTPDKNNPLKQPDLPSQFQLAKVLFWVFALLITAFASATIWLHENKIKGVKKAAKSFLLVGIFVGFTPLLLKFFASRLSGSGLFGDSMSQDVALPIFNEFINTVSVVYYVFGAICVVLGVAGLIFASKKSANKNGGEGGISPSASSLN